MKAVKFFIKSFVIRERSAKNIKNIVIFTLEVLLGELNTYVLVL